jgi:hypothetical protein
LNSEMVREMIEKDRSEWDLLTAILDRHPGENLHGPNSIPWTSRDVYAHLARWINYSNREMEAYCTGKSISPAIKNPEELNTLWQKKDNWMTFQQAREKANDAFNQHLDQIQSIPVERWDKNLEKITGFDGAEHFAAHRSYIQV